MLLSSSIMFHFKFLLILVRLLLVSVNHLCRVCLTFISLIKRLAPSSSPTVSFPSTCIWKTSNFLCTLLMNSSHFPHLLLKTLCVDLILGIDFFSCFAANIDVERRQFSLKTNGRRITINVDDTLRPPFVPIRSVADTVLPPKSSAHIFVSSPVSSLSSIFIPTSTFLEHPHLSTQQKHGYYCASRIFFIHHKSFGGYSN